MPTPEQLKKLEEYKDHYDSLAEAEQFAVTVIQDEFSNRISHF